MAPAAGNYGFKRDFFVCFSLTILAACLFALAFPNPLIEDGFGAAAFIAYLPVFITIYRSNAASCLFFGAFYGLLSTSLFNYWLFNFHPAALAVVSSIHLVYFAVFFVFLRLAVVLFPRSHYLLQWLLWIVFEYTRSLGFLGYTYGVTGYSQYLNETLISSAAIFGVWGVSALVIFPQAFFASVFNGAARFAPRPARAAAYGAPSQGEVSLRSSIKRNAAIFILTAAVLSAAFLYGVFTKEDFSDFPYRIISLVQQNDDPWKNDVEGYSRTLRSLKNLSREALLESRKKYGRESDMVVWPETAFVPMIYWHTHYRTDAAYYALVKELTDFLAEEKTPFLIGNDDGRRVLRDGRLVRVDYNAAMLFEKGRIAGLYRKRRLVPFSEHFPYKKQLPFVYDALVKGGMTFWEKGEEAVVFKTGNEDGSFSFSVPICFEDGFGGISREFVRGGAQIIVNITNDSWGKSIACQKQHLALSVFRAVENRRSVVRAASSGQTCVIYPNGKIAAQAPAFTAAILSEKVPLSDKETFYTKHGDFFPKICAAIAFALLIVGLIKFNIKKLRAALTKITARCASCLKPDKKR
ncbi:MAG: apolipoprotein N-acyltransferase [Spirochaetaceae bacterium]|jgi:apolipoprotein N-acyltransferase|nr:apolipoprotein N-acyltransferase [Spirochaetaceae bacterium]